MGAGVVEKVESWREADGVRVDKIMTRPDYSRSGLFFQPGQPVMLDASPRQPVRQTCHHYRALQAQHDHVPMAHAVVQRNAPASCRWVYQQRGLSLGCACAQPRAQEGAGIHQAR